MKREFSVVKSLPGEEYGVKKQLYILIRIAVVLAIILLFIPTLNPARISDLINRNISLFTTGISFDQLTSGMGKAFTKNWLDKSTIVILMIGGGASCIGIILQTVSACATLGERRLKRIGIKGILAGAVITLAGAAGIYLSYCQMLSSVDSDKLKVCFPKTFLVLIILTVFSVAVSIFLLLKGEKVDKTEKLTMQPKYQLFLMAVPFVALTILFGYLPLLGWRYAFFDYKAGDLLTLDNFVGLKWFSYLWENEATRSDIIRVIKNTLGISGLTLATSWVSMAFAVLLNEIKNTKYRRVIQTFTTVPNFISWVLIFAVGLAIFSADGFISNIMVQSGQWANGKNFLMNDTHVWLQMLFWAMWKGTGWGAIIYIAAISGIDQGLYEAAEVDGAGRFRKMWHITIPELLPTYCVLLLMSVGNLLSNGLDQYLVFENSVNSASIQVLDLYVYNLGVAKGLIPLTTAIGMLKSVISIVLVLVANKIAKFVRGENII